MLVNGMKPEDFYDDGDNRLLSHCTLCPRECGVNRFKGATGYCRSDAGPNVASICNHRGEEPSISGPDGICNIFFSGCNLRCIYCQNYEISQPAANRIEKMTFDELITSVTGILDRGIKALGFVSPSHSVPQVKAIIRAIHSLGYFPVTVYNTNSYDKVETIKDVEDITDVYLPDYKYVTRSVAKEFSDASDYPEVALRALREMYYQKGSILATDEDGRAERGILIRHLVLPGHPEESKKVLRSIAEEISTGINISLMSQYHPTPYVLGHKDLGRILYRAEYQDVVREMESLGFRNGWIQDMDSYRNYRPDFRKKHPFE